MDESIARTIRGISSWEDLKQFEVNARGLNRFTNEISEALQSRSAVLGRELIAAKTGLNVANLSPAEEKIVEAVSEYVAVMRLQGKYPQRTFEQLQNRGFIGAAECAVCRSTPTQGFQTLVDENLEALSYEQIVVDHPQEFSPRSLWFSRKTLKMPVDGDVPPADIDGDTQSKTSALISWLKEQAAGNEGTIPVFSNADAAVVMGMEDIQRYGQVHGNIQSRIDFACYKCGLPPLGLTANAPFAKAWGQQAKDKGGRSWTFPVSAMQVAAQSKCWSDMDFDQIQRETERLPGLAHVLWKEELTTNERSVRDWALSFGDAENTDQTRTEASSMSKRNPIWSRDELILALDLYLRHRASPPAKDSLEVMDLSKFLNQMGDALEKRSGKTYRNSNGVYMKMMNFRRIDPSYTQDGKVGLTRGNKDEHVVWSEFANNTARLAQVVSAIKNAVTHHLNDDVLGAIDEPGIQEAEEGRVLTRLHRYKERSQKLVEQCKKNAMSKFGRLSCEACGFDFSVAYGSAGSGLIDVHHTRPVHTLEEGDKTKIEDLALLCSNCHQVVHSSRQWLTIDQIKAILQKVKS